MSCVVQNVGDQQRPDTLKESIRDIVTVARSSFYYILFGNTAQSGCHNLFAHWTQVHHYLPAYSRSIRAGQPPVWAVA